MNRNHLWKLVLILGLLAWSVYEMNPPTSRPLIEYFRTRAVSRDDAFKTIVDRAQAAEKEHPLHDYANLLEAIGTNDITHYFPFFDVKKEAHPTTYVLNRLQREAAGKIKLGLDLQGGVSFLVEMGTNNLADSNTNANGTVTTDTALNQAIEVLRKRVDKFGVAEPLIQPEGDNRILIQLPGLSETGMADAQSSISKVAFLEFKLVHPESDDLLAHGEIAPGYELKSSPHNYHNQEKGPMLPGYLVKRRAELTGGIKTAIVTRDNFGAPEVAFTLDDEAARIFGKVTRENVGHQLAIILDGELHTAPNINGAIENGSGEITGNYTFEEARSLANVLQNPLKTPLKIIGQNNVDPTLGKDSIRSGIKASIIGVIAVSAFMLVYYMLAGLVANVALICNIIILLGVMCALNATFTLPGIAGVVLTIGMAVDANVLIFERIREETAKGKSLRGALSAGYDRAFSTIFDSHVTTLISSVILIFMGTGPVKGFGVTLTWGVAASLFTALVVTRLIFDWLIIKNYLKSLRMLHVIRATKLNFMKLAIPAFVASWTLIAVGIGYGVYRGVHEHNLLGVEFAGGESITLSVDQQHKPSVDKIREVASRISGGEVLVAYQHNLSTDTDTLRVTAREFGTSGQEALGDKIFNGLKQEFPDANLGGQFGKPLSIERVGPTVGEEIQRNALLASLVAMFGILIYVAFRYEFSFAVSAVVAILHDVLMTLGCYFLAGRVLNATTVAAVLTIIGFSINDPIVIFDRIREDLKLGVRGSFRDVVNQALNQTLSRTLITSGTVFIATMSLYIFGGGPINDFAFTFLVGIITGTYSSIYIASAMVLWWHKGHRPKIGSTQMTAETAAPAKSATTAG
jgi:SecD/SecF fusion protein